MDTAGIIKRKLPDATGVWSAYVLGADEFGTWFFTPAGSPIRWTNLEGKGAVWEFDVLCLIPPDDWYFALWWNGHPSVEIGVDVTAPATRDGGAWSWVDLEIDLHRFVDGRVESEDEDEFEDSVARGYISQTQQTQALRITPIIERMLRDRLEPFGGVGPHHLAEALTLGLAPLEPPAL